MLNGFTREELLSLAWEKPIMAQLEVTANCNQRCFFCFNACHPKKVYPNLPTKSWKTIIDKLVSIGVWRFDFTGGEPFFYPGLAELAAYVKGKGFTANLNTNGTLSVQPLLPLVDEMIFSVHGLGEIHDQVTGRPGSFALIERNLAEASASEVKIVINMFLVEANYHQLLETYQYLAEHYRIDVFAPAFAIKSLFGNRYEDQALTITSELLADYIGKLKRIPADKLELKHGFHSIFIDDPDHYHGKMLLPNCAAGKYKLVVASDGNVYPCNFFRGEEYCCGNLLNSDPREVWEQGKGFQPFRILVLEEKVPEKCKSCLKIARCYSGCRAWSETYQLGGFNDVCDSRCELGAAYLGS